MTDLEPELLGDILPSMASRVCACGQEFNTNERDRVLCLKCDVPGGQKPMKLTTNDILQFELWEWRVRLPDGSWEKFSSRSVASNFVSGWNAAVDYMRRSGT